MSDERLTGKVNRVEGEIRSDGRKYLRHSCPGYVYAQSNDGYHAMFFSTHCDQYRIGDKVRIELTRVDEAANHDERMQTFGKWRMDYLNALYARGLRGDRQKELDILTAIDAFQDFVRDGRLPDDAPAGEALLDKPWLRKGIVDE